MAILSTTDLGDSVLCVVVDHDPEVTATDAPINSLIISAGTNLWYRKTDSGSSTNVRKNADFSGGVGTEHLFSYDTTTQIIPATSTFTPFTFSNNGLLSGWSHTVSTSVFTCDQTGTYSVYYRLNVLKTTGGGGVDIAARMTLAGTEIPGSYAGATLTGNNISRPLPQSVLVAVTSGQALVVQVATPGANVNVQPPTSIGSPTTLISATLTIRRVL